MGRGNAHRFEVERGNIGIRLLDVGIQNRKGAFLQLGIALLTENKNIGACLVVHEFLVIPDGLKADPVLPLSLSGGLLYL